MAENSNIEWCDHTFNPWIGCFKISAGCKNCYAETLINRFNKDENLWGHPSQTIRRKTKQPWKDVRKWQGEAKRTGIRKKVFCASLADIFEDHPMVRDWRKDFWKLIVCEG